MSRVFRSSALAASLFVVTQGAFGCLMAEGPQPPTTLHGPAIHGRFAIEGKPLGRLPVELRTRQGLLIGKTITDENGSYSFAVRKAGQYELRLLNPSQEEFGIDYTPADEVQDNFDVNFSADYCYSIKVSPY